jgi:hypothetical protein
MIDQTFHDEETLAKAYRAIGGYTSEGDAVEIVSRLLSAGLLIRERTPDSAVPNEPTAPAGTYPESASLPEQRRAFALSQVNPNVRQNTAHAAEIEKFLAGPENAVDPDPSLAVDAPLDGIQIDSGMDAPQQRSQHHPGIQTEIDHAIWNAAIDAVLEQLGIDVPGGGRIGQLQYVDVWNWHDTIEGLKK